MSIETALFASANELETGEIRSALLEIGGGITGSDEERLIRNALLEVYAQRCGEDAAQQLLDEIS